MFSPFAAGRSGNLSEQDDPEKQKEIDAAFNNFALLVIKAEAAEYLELKPQPNVRTQWKRQGDDWKETKVCP